MAQFDFAEVQPGDLGFATGDLILTDEAAFKAAGASGGWISGVFMRNSESSRSAGRRQIRGAIDERHDVIRP